MIYRKVELSFEEVPQFSERDKAYQREDPNLSPFYDHLVHPDSFSHIANIKGDNQVDRELLVRELEKMYSNVSKSEAVIQNIRALSDERTFTIITAHQPSLLTGPLYFIYKICSVISLCRQLNERKEDFKVVPVFVMGGEDHDFEEIATAQIFNQNFTWDTEQVGSTGRMTLEGLENVLTEIDARLGTSPNAEELRGIIKNALASAGNYGQFMFQFVHQLFDAYGLLIVNMDNASFKKKLLPYVLKDLENKDSVEAVNKDQKSLADAGFKDQAYAREVNIFWMDKDRHRVALNGDKTYQIGKDTLSHNELIEKLQSQPECISPNVILRPIFQEIIMPNLAYVGGGGELAYWLERKSLFERWTIPFPMLVRRDSMMIIDKRSAQWLKGSGLEIIDLFDREEQVIGKYALTQAAVDIDLTQEKKSLHEVFSKVKDLAIKIDPTLEKTVLSESAKAIKSLHYLESKLLKAEKNKNEVGINKLTRIKQKLFPGNDGLQERTDNFIPYYLKYGQDWIKELIEHQDPLNKNFKILVEE